MRKSINAIFLFLLVLTSEIVFGKETKTKLHINNKKHNKNHKERPIERIKRFVSDNEENKPFWADRGKRSLDNSGNNINRIAFDMEKDTKYLKKYDFFEEPPFNDGTKNRRFSSSVENIDDDYVDGHSYKDCFGTVRFDSERNFKDRRDDSLPFWGNRGRRNSDEIDDTNEPFWGNRGRRQDEEPFWGTRGRRKDSPFWGARGRRQEEPFWGNRGRRDEMDPFWGNRGRRQDSEPFWGTRGRRQENEQFWGSRGRRDDEPFWGNRGRRKEADSLKGEPSNTKDDLKESILGAIDLIQNDIEHSSPLRRNDQGFWSNRGRDSKLKYLFDSYPINKVTPHQISRQMNMYLKSSDPGTVHDSRIFAEEPQYILVERSSRSSGETEDPFYISRGKKYYFKYNLMKAARDRRGAIEEIVKSVRNDPYYIARGKKSKLNFTSDEMLKAKELICSAVDMIMAHDNGKAKREIDSDRDRRTILKKLAAQLQNDPFPVSRGKKSDGNSEDNLNEFITNLAVKCD